MAQVTSNGIRINYDDLGQGEPALLLMPGWCANRTVFQDLAPRCSTRYRTLVLDWRGHGGSGPPSGDFGYDGLVEDALAVIKASGARQVVPVALAHAGWVAIELKFRLEDRITKLVLLDWIIMEAPAPFLEVLQGMQSPEHWHETVEQILSSWLQGVDNPSLIQFVKDEMGSYGFEMWARAAREIPEMSAIGAARISGHGVATTKTASARIASPDRAQATPAIAVVNGRKKNA